MAQLGTCVDGSPYIKRLSKRTSRLNIFKQDVAAFHLEVLEKAPNLKILGISHNPVQTLDLAPLRHCLLLEELSVGAVEPIDLAPLADCLNLEALSIHCHAWSELDLSPLFGHPRLRSIHISGGRFQELDLSPLGTCPKLSRFGIETQSLSRLDLSPLADCLGMKDFYVCAGNLQHLDLSPCRNWVNLELINLINSSVETLDLKPLSTTRLRRLNLAGLPMTHLNLTPLVGLEALTALVFKPIPKLYLDAQYMDAPRKIASPAIREYLRKGWCSKLSADEVIVSSRVVAEETSLRYFQYPYRFSTYTSEEQHCDLCQQVRPGYKGPFYGRQRIEFVCEECLKGGKLADMEATTNEGDVASLREQLEDMHPGFTQEQIQELVQQRTAELEHRTPHLVTWQNFRWPAHCGDYCHFIKEVGKPDLNELAPDGNGQRFFGEHLREYDKSITNVPDVWGAIRPDSPKDNSTAYSVGVYLFQCLHCQEYVILWDCD